MGSGHGWKVWARGRDLRLSFGNSSEATSWKKLLERAAESHKLHGKVGRCRLEALPLQAMSQIVSLLHLAHEVLIRGPEASCVPGSGC